MEQTPTCLNRRLFLGGALSVVAAPVAARAAEATADLAARLREAAPLGRAVRLPPGVTTIRSLELPAGAILIGARGGSTLRLVGPGPLLYCRDADRLTLEAVSFDGGGASLEEGRGLLDFSDVVRLSVSGCAIRNSSRHGVNLLRCGGIFKENLIERVRDAGYHSLDGLGVDIAGNKVRECGDNGVMVWTTQAGSFEGSRIRDNAIADIHNLSGGDGPYGNGVSIWGSGSVRVENNRIDRCAYTAVRNNAGHDVVVVGNQCRSFGEKAMYAEFGAKRSEFRNNLIEDAGGGIAVANAEKGTDVAVVSGNRIFGLKETHPDREFGPEMFWQVGILAEKNCSISGNLVRGPAWIGIVLGGYRENIRVEDNEVVGADYGVGFATGRNVGTGMIVRNKITASRKAAICAMAGPSFIGDDLLGPKGDKIWPGLILRDNSVE
ncbi:TIGR03808 family TAT-translocated repetitive protein [Methylocystis heyeri]|uniref:TIGR03808 family TAT-translocated repetitive protein n=1 Tax=Methylocystis heyeri TaxID=391905 RepID=A0A6B8KGX4_9HYPH|nr:TIGR03808 family TAT-translocated repetitive protein [Methylocystis heyeri]